MWRFMHKLLMRLAAEKDATHGIGPEAESDHVVRRLGVRPVLNTATHERHAQVAASLAKAAELDEVRHDLAVAEEERRVQPSPRLLGFGIALLLGAEFFAAMLLLSGLGLTGIELAILSAALTAGLVGLTGRVVEAAPTADAAPDTPPSARFRLLVGLYLLVVVALAITRSATVEADVEGNGVVRFAFGAVLLVLTVGPAWLLERWLRLRRPAAAIADRIRELKTRGRRLAREVARAEAFTARMAEAGQAFDETAEQLRAEYRSTHRLTRSRGSESLTPSRRRKP